MTHLPDNLPQILRARGLTVVEVDGWQDRGRPTSTGGFDPVGVLNHHTATGPMTSPAAVIRLLVQGRKDLPGPLCHLSVDRRGVVYIVAAGRANHAGTARKSGTVAAGDGNKLYIGIEAQNNGVGEPWPKAQYDALVLLNAVLDVDITGNSAQTNRGHKETSVTGKIDPAGPTPYGDTFDMDEFRSRVAAKIQELKKPVKKPAPKTLEFVVETNNVMSLPLNKQPLKTLQASGGWSSVRLLQEIDGARIKDAARKIPGFKLVDIPNGNTYAAGVLYETSEWEEVGHRYVKQYDGVGGISYTRHIAVAELKHKATGQVVAFISFHDVTAGNDRARVRLRKRGRKALRKIISGYRALGIPVVVGGDYNDKRSVHPTATLHASHGIDHVYAWAGRRWSLRKKRARVVQTPSDHDALIVRIAVTVK